MISPFIIPILAISIGLVAVIGKVIVRPWLRLQERRLEIEANMTAEKAAQYAASIERLEQRVRVLERIATDKGSDLAAQIDALRDRDAPPLN
ncbi:MAG: hypothetical protein U5M50_02670 [Sphingobium sp.]|nr:hypothetical protein [Sphingobium sp.]